MTARFLTSPFTFHFGPEPGREGSVPAVYSSRAPELGPWLAHAQADMIGIYVTLRHRTAVTYRACGLF